MRDTHYLRNILIAFCLLFIPACSDIWIESADGDMKAVSNALSHGIDPNKVDDDNGATPLFLAAQNGHDALVRFLLAHGANPDQIVILSARETGIDEKDAEDNNDDSRMFNIVNRVTPLFIAAQNKHYKIVKLLLEYGANPEQPVTVGQAVRVSDGSLTAPGLGVLSLNWDQLKSTAVANGLSSQIDSLLPYSCDIQGCMFRTKRNLELHELTHKLFPERKTIGYKEFYWDLNQPQSENYDAYSNEYLWMTKEAWISERYGRIWKKLYSGRRDEAKFIFICQQIIQGDFLNAVKDRMQGTPPPELNIKQMRFESTRHYFSREASAGKKLTSYKNILSRNERKTYRDLELREKLIVYRLFVLYFGRPVITNISYDPDTRLFGIRVEGKNGGVFRFTFADRIMNEVAPAYEKKIRKASVKILLRASGGRLYIDGGSLLFPDGTSERILPFHEEDYHPKDVTIANFPKIKVPNFSPPEKILSNERMKLEGKKIVRDTVYFQGLK